MMRPILYLLSFALAACQPHHVPQAEHSYRAGADMAGVNGSRTAPEIAAMDQAALRRALGFATLVQSSDAPYAGMGFAKGRTMGYAVTVSGTAGAFPDGAGQKALEHLAPRINRVMLAGPSGRHLVGLSANGTMMVWDLDNMRRQVVLRPQATTFGQVHLFDAKPLSGSNLLVTAVEGNMLEIWNLTSGHRLAGVKVAGGQPRVIAGGSSPNFIIYGTNSGEVRLWKGGAGSEFLYAHQGPVMDISYDPLRKRVFSAAKDGSVYSRSFQRRQVQPMAAFPMAADLVMLDPAGRHVLAAPATGAPQLFDLASGQGATLKSKGRGHVGKPVFLPGGRGLLLNLNNGMVGYWPSLRPEPYLFKPRHYPAVKALDYAVAPYQNIVALLTDAGTIEYWDLARRSYMTTALVSKAGLGQAEISPDGRRIMVALADRTIVSFAVDPAQARPIEIFQNEADHEN